MRTLVGFAQATPEGRESVLFRAEHGCDRGPGRELCEGRRSEIGISQERLAELADVDRTYAAMIDQSPVHDTDIAITSSLAGERAVPKCSPFAPIATGRPRRLHNTRSGLSRRLLKHFQEDW